MQRCADGISDIGGVAVLKGHRAGEVGVGPSTFFSIDRESAIEEYNCDLIDGSIAFLFRVHYNYSLHSLCRAEK